jgi:membrane-bound ClpP family serine protease
MELFDFVNNIGLLQALFFIIGLILVIIEIFYPGFGAPGITGLILLFIGVLITARNVLDALIMIVVLLAMLGIALTIVLKSATKGRLSKTIVLSDALNKESGFSGTEDYGSFVNKEGLAVTALRPSGTANIDGNKLDVVTEGEFIQKDSKIKVIKVLGSRIVVKEVR